MVNATPGDAAAPAVGAAVAASDVLGENAARGMQ
jgi:hypothetical protein